MATDDFSLTFWGVRGSLPVPGPGTVIYGGNTSCLEVRCGERLIILDMGTGSHALGKNLLNTGVTGADIFLTHGHYDHIEGFLFFAPFHCKNWQVRLWSGHSSGKMTTRQLIEKYTRRPFLPVGPECMNAQIDYLDFSAGDAIDLGDGILVRTVLLNHPGGATGYRIEYDGRSICYITDMEHTPGVTGPGLVEFVAGAGIVVYDASYSDDDFERFAGFGHSTWQEGARLCTSAGAGLYAAFHHMSMNDDRALATIEENLKSLRPNSCLAREGLRLIPEI